VVYKTLLMDRQLNFETELQVATDLLPEQVRGFREPFPVPRCEFCVDDWILQLDTVEWLDIAKLAVQIFRCDILSFESLGCFSNGKRNIGGHRVGFDNSVSDSIRN